MTTKPDIQLFLDGNRGQYIPRDFANTVKRECVTGVNANEWEKLEAGPDAAWHLETWENVLNNAVINDADGTKYRLHQDGDLWLVPEGMEYDDAAETYYWPAEGQDGDGIVIVGAQ
jgi:hypothetical protein